MGYQIFPDDIDQKLPNYEQELGFILHKIIGKSICDFFGIDGPKISLQAYKGPYFNCVGAESPDFAPHVDRGHISTFAYLSPPENCSGGTRIFRHIPTDTINIVSRNVTSLKDMLEKPLDKPLVESTEEWELIEFFEMKYNRLIAFNSSAIHKPDLTGGKFTLDFEHFPINAELFFPLSQCLG